MLVIQIHSLPHSWKIFSWIFSAFTVCLWNPNYLSDIYFILYIIFNTFPTFLLYKKFSYDFPNGCQIYIIFSFRFFFFFSVFSSFPLFLNLAKTFTQIPSLLSLPAVIILCTIHLVTSYNLLEDLPKYYLILLPFADVYVHLYITHTAWHISVHVISGQHLVC